MLRQAVPAGMSEKGDCLSSGTGRFSGIKWRSVYRSYLELCADGRRKMVSGRLYMGRWRTPRASSTYFLAGSSTAGLTGRTVGQEHMPTGRFSNMKYKSFHAPKLSATAYKSGETQAAAPKKVTLSAGSMKLTTGGREALTAKISPSAFPVDGLTWSSSNTKVADVTVMGSAGKVYITGKSAGTATITVSWKKKTLASCKVTVSKKAASVKYKIRLNAGTLPLR